MRQSIKHQFFCISMKLQTVPQWNEMKKNRLQEKTLVRKRGGEQRKEKKKWCKVVVLAWSKCFLQFHSKKNNHIFFFLLLMSSCQAQKRCVPLFKFLVQVSLDFDFVLYHDLVVCNLQHNHFVFSAKLHAVTSLERIRLKQLQKKTG